jgi:hypothetical protein
MVKRLTLLVCLLLSFAFAFAQSKAEPQESKSQQDDRKVNAEQLADDSGLMLGCLRAFEMADMHINSAPLPLLIYSVDFPPGPVLWKSNSNRKLLSHWNNFLSR